MKEPHLDSSPVALTQLLAAELSKASLWLPCSRCVWALVTAARGHSCAGLPSLPALRPGPSLLPAVGAQSHPLSTSRPPAQRPEPALQLHGWDCTARQPWGGVGTPLSPCSLSGRGVSTVRRLPPWAGGALEKSSEFLPGAQGGAGLGIGGRVSQGQGTESRVSVGTARRPESGALSTRICQRVTLRPGGGRIGFRVACLPCAFTGREEEARGCLPRGDRGRAEQGFISQGRPWAPGVMMRMLGALGPSCTSVWEDTSHEGLSSAHPASPLSGGSQQGFVIDPRVDHPWMDRAEGGLEPGPSRVGAQAGTPVEPSASAHPHPPAPTGQLLRKSQASTAGGGARGSASPSRGPGRPSGDTK